MIKKVLTLVNVLVLFWQVNAQQVITVVDGASTDHDHVFEEYYHYSHVQYIYDKTLINQSGTITDIKFEHNNTSCTTSNISIYMGNTAKASFSGSSDWMNSGMTLVYSGSITPTNGWYNINISDFYYDNTYNLAIIIDNDDGSYCGSSSYLHYYGASSTYTMLRDRGSSDIGDYGSISTVGTRQLELASLQLVFLNTAACSGTPSGGTANASITSGCAVFNTNLTVSPSPTESDLEFQWQISSDNSNWLDIPGATSQSYTAAVSNTSYYRRAITCLNSGMVGYSSSVLVIADCYNMSSGTVYTCSGHFYDSGGPSGNYANSETRTMTICSGNTSEYIKFVFNSFYTSSSDILNVYDGTSTAAPLIFSLSGQGLGNDMPPDIVSSDSCITFVFTSDGSVNYAGWDANISCTTQPNSIARDFCGGAAHICNLNGYTGKTSSFYGKDLPGNMCDTDEGPQPCSLFDGNLHNNSWVSFTASGTSASFDVTVNNCSQNQGIQLGIYSGSLCDNFQLLSDISLTSGTLGLPTALPNNTTTTVSVPFGAAPNLIPGQTYYIMIDGQSGDVCNYSILATSGVAQASIDVTDTTVCSGQPLTLTASGGTGYIWSTNPVTNGSILSFNPTATSSYTVTITGGNPLCPDMAEITSQVTVNPLPQADGAPSIQSICSGQSMSNITLSADIIGTVFSWSRNNPAGISTSIPLSGSGVPIGGIISGNTLVNTTSSPIIVEFYILPIASTTCSGVRDTVRVTVKPLPTATVSSFINPSGCGFSDGSITVSSNASYSYTWNTNPVQNTNVASGIPSGSYQVTVSIGGCDISLSQSLNDPGSPTVGLIANDSSICMGETILFEASGITSGTYEFFVDGNSVQGPSSTSTWSSTTLSHGEIVSVTGIQAGCQGTSTTIPVLVTSIPTLSLTNQNQVLCSDNSSNSMVVNINQPNSYFNWTSGATTGLVTDLSAGETNVISGGSIAGAHFVNSGSSPITVDITISPTVVSSSVCSGTPVTAHITVNPLPVPSSITTSDVTVCAQPWNGGASIDVSIGQSPFSYSLDNNSFINDHVFYGLSSGSHNLTIMDSYNCSFDTSFVIGTNTGAEIDSIQIQNISCNGLNNGQIIIYSADAATYQLQGFSVQTDSVFTGIAPGSYDVFIWDAGSCQASGTIQITQPQVLANQILIQDSILCHGDSTGELTVQVTGGTTPYTYLWNNPSGSITPTIIGLAGDQTYSVTVTDVNNCSTVGSLNLTQPSALDFALHTSNISCNGGNNGFAYVMASGGISPYTYLWSDNLATVNDTVLHLVANVQYFVNVTDEYGCAKIDSFTLQEPTALLYQLNMNNPLCWGNTGSASILINGGTPPYNYTWNGGNYTDSLYNDGFVANVEYIISVIDSNGCEIGDTVLLSQPDSLWMSAISQNLSCYMSSNGQIQLTVNGGTIPYSYSWQGFPTETTSTLTGLAQDNYSVTVTDSHNCTISRTISLTQPDSLIINTLAVNVSCNGFSDGSITVDIDGGTIPYTYSWNTGLNIDDIISLDTGKYTLTVTDVNGCSDSVSVTISQPDSLMYNINATHVSCFGVADGELFINVNGGTTPYNYLWSNGVSQSTISLLAGNVMYYVTVNDNHNCQFIDSVYISQPPVLQVSDSVGSGFSGFINIAVAGATPDYVYHWSNGSITEDIDGLSSGTYSLTVTDAQGCTYTANYEVIAEILIPNVITPNGDGYNDDFEILNISLYQNVSVQIFNRWGDQLFTFSGAGTEYAQPSNRFKGDNLPMGSYLYIVNIEGMDPITGAVLIKY